MASQLDALLQKEVDRKEFLATLGFGIASLMGLTTLFELHSKVKTDMSVDAGYGSTPYGGSR